MNSAEVLITFKGDGKDVDRTSKKITSSVSSIAKGVLVATGVTKAFSAAWNLVSKNMDKAIDRFDTLNSFSKVMENLGINAQESQKAIDTMAEKLQGLPTTLQDGASAVQRFTAANKDVTKSTKYFLALNNAILAGKAPIVNQQAALEQLTQAYSRGKFEANEWKSILVAMPAQMNQLAEAFGYTSTSIGGDFYNAIQSGKISLDEMMDKMVELNEKGGKNFASWEKQARGAVDGIRTSIEVMNGRISQGIEKFIRAVDEGMKDAGFSGISSIFIGIGDAAKTALANLGQELKPLITGLLTGSMSAGEATQSLATKFLNVIQNAIKSISDNMPVIVSNFMQILSGLISSIGDALPTLIPQIMDAVSKLTIELTKEENLTLFVQAGEKLGKGLIDGLINTLLDTLSSPEKLFNAIKMGVIGLPGLLFHTLLADLINKGKEFFSTLLPKLASKIMEISNKIPAWLSDLPEKLKQIGIKIIAKLVAGIINSVSKVKSSISNIKNAILQPLNSITSLVSSVGLNIVKGIGKGITSGVSWIKNQIKSFVGNITNFIKKIFKIGSPSKLMANEVGQWIPKGIGVGITANTDAVNKSMTNLEKEMMSTFQVSPQLAQSSALHYSPTVVNNVQVNMEQDPLGQMVRNVKTFSGGAKNDYNYGMGV